MSLRHIATLSLFAACASAWAAPEEAQSDALQSLKTDIAERPSRVLIAVEDALTMDEQAACEIVKSAIRLTKADAKLTGEIVHTALKHSPGMSAVIVECAVDTAPQAAAEIKKAMQRALGEAEEDSEDISEGSGKGQVAEATGKEPTGKVPTGKAVSGKAPAPEPVEVEADIWDFGFFHSGIGGIYLTPPSSGLSGGGFVPRPNPPQPSPEPNPPSPSN